MSLYNALFGVNPAAGILLQALGTKPDAIPRFRDCYLDTELDEPRIAIHTRTGGGNRAAYERGGSEQTDWNPDGPFNGDLRDLPGFIGDEDDDFDCTYATFYFAVPEAFAGIISTIHGLTGAAEAPAVRWARVLSDLQARETTPETERALAIGKQIVAHISDEPRQT
ncbi:MULTISPECIES: hypothetical protein [Aurantimonas]|uniref:hypothetical protein n=1 Tax=Aurantimonas TaxID=182269 RepID=UPI003511A3F7